MKLSEKQNRKYPHLCTVVPWSGNITIVLLPIQPLKASETVNAYVSSASLMVQVSNITWKHTCKDIQNRALTAELWTQPNLPSGQTNQKECQIPTITTHAWKDLNESAASGAAPVTVDDIGAGLLPQAFQVFELSMGVVPQLFISTLQKVLCSYQCHVHLHTTFMLRLMDFLHIQQGGGVEY